jgi:hypothetical protein
MVLLLPWCGSLIKSAKLPGGWEVTFREVDKAGEKITGETFSSSLSSSSSSASSSSSVSSSSSSSFGATDDDLMEPSFVAVADYDPQLAVVGLRIEIERRIRTLANMCEIPPKRSLVQTLRMLVKKEALDQQFASGIEDLIAAGNQAAHGASVEPDVADWAVRIGPRVLDLLDKRCSERSNRWR